MDLSQLFMFNYESENEFKLVKIVILWPHLFTLHSYSVENTEWQSSKKFKAGKNKKVNIQNLAYSRLLLYSPAGKSMWGSTRTPQKSNIILACQKRARSTKILTTTLIIFQPPATETILFMLLAATTRHKNQSKFSGLPPSKERSPKIKIWTKQEADIAVLLPEVHYMSLVLWTKICHQITILKWLT